MRTVPIGSYSTMGDRAGGGGESLQLRLHLDLDLKEEKKPAMRNSKESVLLAESTARAKALWQSHVWHGAGLEVKLLWFEREQGGEQGKREAGRDPVHLDPKAVVRSLDFVSSQSGNKDKRFEDRVTERDLFSEKHILTVLHKADCGRARGKQRDQEGDCNCLPVLRGLSRLKNRGKGLCLLLKSPSL